MVQMQEPRDENEYPNYWDKSNILKQISMKFDTNLFLYYQTHYFR